MSYSEISLSNAVEFIVDNRGKTVPVQEGGIPLIATNCISNANLYPEFSNVRYVSDEVYANWFRSHPEPDDIILTNKGSKNGAICLVPNPVNFCIAQDMVALRAKKGSVYPRYLFAVLRSSLIQNRIKELNVDSVIPHFKKTDFNKLFFPLLNYERQVVIGDFYYNFCKKIELNRQTNQTLEQIAQAIFKSWFVDFEPTRAKLKAKQAGQDPERAAMAAISGKTLDELDQLTQGQLEQLKTTADLFSDVLVDSELGEVPEGWGLGELRDIADFSTERIDVSELTLETYVSTENMLEGKKGVAVASALPSVKTVPRFIPHQILISNIRPYFMKIWLARFEGGRSNDVLGIEAKEPESVEYLYNLLYQDEFFNFMMTTSTGAKMPRGDKKAIVSWVCVQPTIEVKKAYASAVGFFYDIIDSLNTENDCLGEVRDTLLPKLLTGELSTEVSEAV